ncbi:L-arginine:L-lysine amidinotransferase [Fulvia fulva]|uniref:Glycine amidinotransferase, mitochondrial n=1 Tax=Passalora fulva TaxID=5499 RepID=A0A9Q8LFA8_PASFU|nr:L-arginine:L-lysine amidinotransferase [Fulvia fulva]KAK4615889.1 L-arginine:L-lysine amidinotransferase [Fulvia fulva]KAK4616862.1 L-arginine:L-lysine amidinotransferase [Fulvia fulva]UJO16345.1 L-arginine:L-lysine amidinotransferase [Fulvia fulva]WPV18920.1 L-arginine:L-lysine amidinotransferase [Fulvia fulva]WPV34275.1 L-arginine:L-lysine amidinotransferase [Fulvia fulva]
MATPQPLLVFAEDEWSPLRSVIVGRAEDSAFPSEPLHMMAATMPSKYVREFRPSNPFPPAILARAQEELDNLASILQNEGIRVYRPEKVNWLKAQGYTGSMPRDGLMSVGSALIEAPFAWRCRRHEITLGYSGILSQLSMGDSGATICRAPLITGQDTLYSGTLDSGTDSGTGVGASRWSINNSRPAFDAADFMRFGKVIIGQLSHVTNRRGVDYLRAVVPAGYSVEILKTTDEHAMHIDATLLPLRRGLMVYHPERISEHELRRHEVFHDWELLACPMVPKARQPTQPPLYMCTPWLMLNALSLDEERVLIEANETEFASWLTTLGFKPILVPFTHVNSIGGSFHCATVDLVRSRVDEAPAVEA